jgi:hypothetical protein
MRVRAVMVARREKTAVMERPMWWKVTLPKMGVSFLTGGAQGG